MIEQDVIAVFPLPNVVFFPKTDLPLHIFEPRYCAMVKDTIENHQLIGMFLLEPGWQDDYYGNPPVHGVGCAGELSHFELLPEDKYNIVLKGFNRVRLLETTQEFPYRKARVQILPDLLTASAADVDSVRLTLLREFQTFLRLSEPQSLPSIKASSDFAYLVNTIASTLQLDVDIKRNLLEQDDLYLRAVEVEEYLKTQVAVLQWSGKFAHLRPKDPTVN